MIRWMLGRRVALVGVIAVVAFCLGAAEGDRVFDCNLTILGEKDKKPITSFKQDGSGTFGGKVVVKQGITVEDGDVVLTKGKVVIRGRPVLEDVEALTKVVQDLKTRVEVIEASEAMTTKVVWLSKDFNRGQAPPWGAKAREVFDFGRPVVEAVAFVGAVDWRKGLGGVGDVHFSVGNTVVDRNTVVVNPASLFEGGNLDRMTVVVVARVKTK